MKKLFTKTLTVLFLVAFFSIPVSTTKGAGIIAPKTETPISAEAQILLTRLGEIDSMSKKELSSAEKKELRREVKSIKAQLAEMGGGIYISVGAIIIILLLLIILL